MSKVVCMLCKVFSSPLDVHKRLIHIDRYTLVIRYTVTHTIR